MGLEYGQFCPIAKAMEVIGEKWTVLIIREALMGSTRFSEFQRGLSLISPTLLTKRLDSLVRMGLLLKKKIPSQRGHEYFPTARCKELLPTIRSLGDWGMRWARSSLTDSDYDVELLMLYLQRSIVPQNLPASGSVIRFKFTDIDDVSDWWLVVSGEQVDVCVKDPGKDVDVYFTSSVKTMADIWMGGTTYRKAVAGGALKIVGNRALTRNVTTWMRLSDFTELPPASKI